MCLTAVKYLDFAKIMWFSGTSPVLALTMRLSLFAFLGTLFCIKANTKMCWTFSQWVENRSQWKWTMLVSGKIIVVDSSFKTFFNLQSISTYLSRKQSFSDKHSARKCSVIPQRKWCVRSSVGYTELACSIIICYTEALFVVFCWFGGFFSLHN